MGKQRSRSRWAILDQSFTTLQMPTRTPRTKKPAAAFDPQIVWRDPNELTPYHNNTKLHPTEQIDKIASAIAAFGWDQPIVIDEKGVIIKGHGRRLAALRMQLKRVPVIVRDDLTEAEKMAARISDNKIAESPWDDEALKLEMGALSELDFDLTLTGWDAEDLSAFMGDELDYQPPENSGKEENQADVDDLLKQAEEGAIAVRTPLGTLWQLGRSFLMVGDSTNAGDVARLMAGDKAAICWTDPPYNVGYDPEERASGFSEERLANPLGTIANDKMPDADFRQFLDRVYARINESLAAGCPIYICHADTMGHLFRQAFIDQPWKLQSCLIWKKTVFTLGRADYHWQHEPILYGWKEGAGHRYFGDRKQTTILEFATAHYDQANCDTDGYVHPTQKPTTLIEYCLHNSSRPGDIVLDLFGGSGSTLIACERTGRSARLMELDPKFATVIVERWERFTGQTARLVEEF